MLNHYSALCHSMPSDLRVTIVVDNTPSQEKDHLMVEHGLSILLDLDLGSESLKLLWDTGASSRVLLHNIDALNIDPREVDLICLSHGHYDHTGGLMAVLQRMSSPVPVIAHPHIFAPKLKANPSHKFIGAPFSRSEAESAGAVFICCPSPLALASGVTTTGEIERRVCFETTEGFLTIKNGKLYSDIIPDDQALAVSLPGKGLVVITGCAHSGIINTISQAQKIAGEEKLYAVIGGFHLMNANEGGIAATVEAMRDLHPTIIRPGHCTGERAICHLQEVLGERCLPLAVGDTIQL